MFGITLPSVLIIGAIIGAGVIVGRAIWARIRRSSPTTVVGTVTAAPPMDEVETEKEDLRIQKRYKSWYWWVVALVVLLLGALTLVLLVVGIFAPKETLIKVPSLFTDEVGIGYSHVYLALAAISALLTYRFIRGRFEIIASYEQATLLAFGRAIFNLSGEPIVVLPFCTIAYGPGPKARLQEEFPADHKYLWMGKTDAPDRPDGMVDPYFITTGGKDRIDDPEKDSVLELRQNVRVAYTVAIVVSNLRRAVNVISVKKEIGADGKPTGRLVLDVDEIFRQLQDTSKGTVNNLFGTHTPEWIVGHQDEIQGEVVTALDKKVKNGEVRWGVDVQESRLTLIGFSHDFNIAMKNVPQALYELSKTKREVEGRAYDVQKNLEAQAEGLKKLVAALNEADDPDLLVRYTNAKLAEAGLGLVATKGKDGKFVLIGGGAGGAMSNAFGLVEGLAIGEKATTSGS